MMVGGGDGNIEEREQRDARRDAVCGPGEWGGGYVMDIYRAADVMMLLMMNCSLPQRERERDSEERALIQVT